MPKKKSNLPVNPTEKDQLHYNAVLLEEIRSQMNAVIETVEVTGANLNEKIDGVEKRLTARIEVIEIVVKGNSAKLKEHDKQFEKIDQRFEKIETKLKEHDQRFDRLEEKMDRVVEKVDRHDEEIIFLKSAVSQT